MLSLPLNILPITAFPLEISLKIGENNLALSIIAITHSEH